MPLLFLWLECVCLQARLGIAVAIKTMRQCVFIKKDNGQKVASFHEFTLKFG